MVMQKPGKVSNPLLPNILSQLRNFDRPGQPVTNEELVMLYQLDVFIKEMVNREQLPAQLYDVIPTRVRSAAEKCFKEWEGQKIYEKELD